ncbi:ras-related protein Rab-22A isoform X1 [Microtus oregoni]|uniref:ras-related protein Rab-22A isoform X1 n=2 Tax=Microtus oregoni TaxID=111838 RepID=UPI001BB20EB9|nr:ras-related protein Rab-22A isoform X1 [Microtus oregoni]
MALRELKVCLLGDTGVGKSSIVWRFVEDSFDPNINPTIGASFMTKTVQYQNELHKFLIWDTAGQERFRALAPMYYRGSAAAIIVYDITKEETFSTLKNWVRELRQHGPPSIVVAIAGNKCDLTDVRPKNSIHRCQPAVWRQRLQTPKTAIGAKAKLLLTTRGPTLMKKRVVLDVAGGPVPAIGSRLVPWSLLHAKRTQRNWLLGTLGRLKQVFVTADLCRGLWCAKGPHPWLLTS